MSWLASWMMNPWMLAAGALAVSIPIIIHLLNKRRFKIVEWAAMDFLFDADKKNRRRVRIENLILLLLRCLAMLLIGMMLARPFLSSLPEWLASKQKIERIILLDDSLSMKVVSDNKSALGHAKDEIKKMLSAVANDDKDDELTLFLTSQPERALISSEPVTGDTIETISRQVDDIEVTQGRANYDLCLRKIDRYVSGQQEGTSRVVYVFSDMRLKDWGDPAKPADQNKESANQLLAKLASNEKVADCFVVDAGDRREENLAIVSIVPTDMQIANVAIRYEVTVANYGRSAANDVEVRFRVGDSAPSVETISSIGAGRLMKLDFFHNFNHEAASTNDLDIESQAQESRLTYRVSAEIVRDGANLDSLSDDNSNYYAANVLKGIPVLAINGDPSSEVARNETFFLSALQVMGSGLAIDSVTVNEFITTPLSKYKVIFVCNVDSFSEDRLKALERWVADGGGLVLMPGNQVRSDLFNKSFYNDGKGVSPIKLTQVKGDATQSTWVNATIAEQNHPAIRTILDSGVSVGRFPAFSWWGAEIPSEAIKKETSVILNLSDQEQTPLMCQRKFGKGQVVTFTIPADADWTLWPADQASYIPLMLDLISYLVGNDSDASRIQYGDSINYPVELSLYDTSVSLVDPDDEKAGETAKPFDPDANESSKDDSESIDPTSQDSDVETEDSADSILYQVKFPELTKRGFYTMNLTRKSGQVDHVLFAVNSAKDESDLKRLDVGALNPSFLGEQTTLVSVQKLTETSVSAAENEIWYQLLFVLLVVLATEQFLGWWFGRKR